MKQKNMLLLLTFSVLSTLNLSYADSESDESSRPIGNTYISAPNTPACQDFQNVVLRGFAEEKYIASGGGRVAQFKTDQLYITQNGKPIYSWADGIYEEDSPHLLMSGSKFITNSMVAAAIQNKATFWNLSKNSEDILSLDSKVEDILGPIPRASDGSVDPLKEENYRKLEVRHLVEMSTNMVWNEGFESDFDKMNPAHMLYLNGHSNMTNYVLSQPYKNGGPGEGWIYSSGNFVVLQKILKTIYGDSYIDSLYSSFLTPLGIENAVLEQDKSGVVVGGSHLYFSAKDLAKVGQLYLNDGVVDSSMNSKIQSPLRILPEGWVSAARTLNPALNKESTDPAYIKQNDLPSMRAFWLNKDFIHPNPSKNVVYNPFTKKYNAFRRAFPEIPQSEEMYAAIGHLGNLVVILPKRNIVIAKTAHNGESSDDFIQPLVTKALKCFAPDFVPDTVKDYTLAIDLPKMSFTHKVKNSISTMIDEMGIGSYFIKNGLFGSIVAKELCSFLFVSGAEKKLNDEEAIQQLTEEALGLPSIAATFFGMDLDYSIDRNEKSVTVKQYKGLIIPKKFSSVKRVFKAVRDPDSRLGCTLK